MKRLSYSILTVVLVAGLSLSALSQAQKPADPCAEFKKAPKGETAADKKKRQADLKECTAKQKADANASSKQQTPKDSGKK
jgi:hypothetical protein